MQRSAQPRNQTRARDHQAVAYRLQALHDARILHRDIKPANCLSRISDGRVKLADLGIAADWATSISISDRAGTLPFMAPELFEPTPDYSPASDIYALGITIACMLLPAPPYPQGNFSVLRNWASEGKRPDLSQLRPDLPVALLRVVQRMMSIRREDRPQNATEALAALSDIAPGNAEQATGPHIAGPAPSDVDTSPVAKTIDLYRRIGPWQVGDQVYASANWRGYAVSHRGTGKPARLMHLQADGPLAGKTSYFLKTAERASGFSHPNIAGMLDWGVSDGCVYAVTVSHGQTLQDIVDAGSPLEEHVAIQFMADLALALCYLHERNIVYQMLDPGATAISSDARSALLDWPVFCMPAGSPAVDSNGESQRIFSRMYSAPEIFTGQSTTIETTLDLFGLGVTFWYLLAGKEPYLAALRNRECFEDSDAARRLTAPFTALINQLTVLTPAARPTARETRQRLLHIATQLGISIDNEAGVK